MRTGEYFQNKAKGRPTGRWLPGFFLPGFQMKEDPSEGRYRWFRMGKHYRVRFGRLVSQQ